MRFTSRTIAPVTAKGLIRVELLLDGQLIEWQGHSSQAAAQNVCKSWASMPELIAEGWVTLADIKPKF